MKKLLRSLYVLYFCLIGFPIFAVVTIVAATTCILGCKLGGQKYFSYYPGKIWSQLALILFLCPIKITGRENIKHRKGPYMVMANHQGAFDIFMMFGYLGVRFKWVMKASLGKIPFVGSACQAAQFIFIDSTKPSSIEHTLKRMEEELQQNCSIFIFPEGSRTKDGRMAKFKKGGFLMASQLGVPILPITIEGSFEVLRKGCFIPHPVRLRLHIHPEVSINDLGPYPQNIIQGSQVVREVIASRLPQEVQA